MRLLAFIDHAFALEHEHLVLVRMTVPRRVAARSDLSLTDRTIRRAVLFAQQPADLAAVRAFHLDRLLSDCLTMVDFHGNSSFFPFSPSAASNRRTQKSLLKIAATVKTASRANSVIMMKMPCRSISRTSPVSSARCVSSPRIVMTTYTQALMPKTTQIG